MPSLKSVNTHLEKSAELIDRAADEMKLMAVEGNDDYVRKMAATLNSIHDIQRDIYNLEPELEPEYLRGESIYSEDNKHYGEILLRSKELEAQGNNLDAISLVEAFLLKERPEYLQISARKLIQQYQSNDM